MRVAKEGKTEFAVVDVIIIIIVIISVISFQSRVYSGKSSRFIMDRSLRPVAYLGPDAARWLSASATYHHHNNIHCYTHQPFIMDTVVVLLSDTHVPELASYNVLGFFFLCQ